MRYPPTKLACISDYDVETNVRLGEKSPFVTDRHFERIVDTIVLEIQSSGMCLGYRAMWRRLTTTYKLRVSRNTVMKILQIIDPEGVERRKRKRLLRRKYENPGPNYMWHIDGNDKLVPFGFGIHGAIDGFSRKIMWAEVCDTNKNPRVVGQHYLKCVWNLGVIPCIIRCDCGTENKQIEKCQVYFRSEHADAFAGQKSAMYRKSTSNQRIESWWKILRNQMTDYWITLFKDMRESAVFNDADPVHVDCIRFCFRRLIQKDLDRIIKEWNTHFITGRKLFVGPRGKPDIMYAAPELYGCHDFGYQINKAEAEIALHEMEESRPIHPQGCSKEFTELVEIILPGVDEPCDADEAVRLYLQILHLVENS